LSRELGRKVCGDGFAKSADLSGRPRPHWRRSE